MSPVQSAAQLFGWMDFVASITSSLAWPIAIVIVAFAFRKPLISLLEKIRKLAVGNVSFEISETLDAAEKIVQEDSVSTPSERPASNADKQEALQYPPDYVVLNEWRSIEKMLRNLAEMLGMPKTRPQQVMLRDLARKELIDANTAEVMLELRRIRNGAAHGHAVISQADALRFLDLARMVQFDLERASSKVVQSRQAETLLQ